MDSGKERTIESAVDHGEQNSHLSASPDAIREIVASLEKTAGKSDGPVVLLVASGARYFMRQVVEASLPNVVVLGHNEVPAEVRVINLGQVR
jgi:flagellar biosynthesis protein FlhA